MFKTKSSPRRFSAVLATAALVLSGVGASAPAYASDTKKVTISGFAPNSVALTAAMRQRIDRFIRANDEYTFVSCVGFADRAGSATTNNALGKGRAEAGCDQAESASSEVEVVSSRGRWDRIRSGASIRRVEITLSKTATAASAGFLTYFEYMGGEKGIAEVRTLADGTLVLPSPTRPGYVFLGWFNQQYNGTKIGNAGDTYKPNRTRILWAQWFVPSSGGATASGSATISFSVVQRIEDDGFCDGGGTGAVTVVANGVTLGTATLTTSKTGRTYTHPTTSSDSEEECGGTVEITASSGAFPSSGALSLIFTPDMATTFVGWEKPADWGGTSPGPYTFNFTVEPGANPINWNSPILTPDPVVP